MRRRFTLSLLVAGVLCLGVPAGRALAQADISREMITKPTLSADEKKRIEDYVKDRLPQLANADPVVMKKAREDLLSPFKVPGVSVAFRQAYEDAALTELKALAGKDSDRVVVNALRVAAELATTNASALLEQKLADSNMVVRYAAVNGFERTMTALSSRSQSIPQQRVEQMVDRLGKVVTDPKNSVQVMDAGVRALMAARGVDLGSTRVIAVRTLGSSVGEVARRHRGISTSIELQKLFLRTGDAMKAGLADVKLALPPESRRDSAELSGHLLGWAFCQLNTGQLPQAAQRETASQIVNVAETTIIVAAAGSGVTIEPARLSADFEKAARQSDESFIRNIVKIISPLGNAPFNLNGQDFLNCK